ncbi:MAG: type II toxin-antitoxin system MqsA family antitoxin [Candidatus Geothermincolia bacterium]
MTCVICKQGETHLGEVTITLEQGGTTLVVKKVPAEVCVNCGEEYVGEVVANALLKKAAEAVRAGVEVEVRHYAAA